MMLRPPAAVGGEHARDDPLSQEKLGPDIHMIEDVELFRLHLEKGLVERDTGIVHQAIDLPQVIEGSIGDRRNLVKLVEIGLEGGGVPAHGLDLRHRGFGSFSTMCVMQDDVGPLAGGNSGPARALSVRPAPRDQGPLP